MTPDERAEVATLFKQVLVCVSRAQPLGDDVRVDIDVLLERFMDGPLTIAETGPARRRSRSWSA